MAKDYSNIEGLIGNVKESIRNAYDKGYKQGFNDGSLDINTFVETTAYEKGLIDAWNCARKIVAFRTPEEWDSFYDFMEVANYINIFEKYSTSEAITKIKEYEEKQKADSNKVTRQSIIKSQLMDIVNGQKNPVTADEIAEVLKQLKETDNG